MPFVMWSLSSPNGNSMKVIQHEQKSQAGRDVGGTPKAGRGPIRTTH